MRKFLASVIIAFAKFITYPLNPFRRGSAIALACERLSSNVPIITDKGRLFFHANSRRSFHRGWNIKTNEPDTLDWIDAFPDNACFWDIGANVGVFSLYTALNSKTAVLAFEPSGSTFSILNRNIELNKMSNQITAYCSAFSGSTRLDFLNMESMSPGNAMHGFGTEINQFDRPIMINFRQGTIGFSIDDFVDIFSPPLPTHIKVDVDGIEADIIRGGKKTLSSPTVQSIIVEIEQKLSRKRKTEIQELMIEIGFKARPQMSPKFRNVIFDKIDY